MTEDQALKLTEKINKQATDLCWLVEKAHDEEAYRALGHETFKDYVAKRLVISEVHAYRVLAQARVIRELEKAAGIEHSTNTRVSHREVQAIKRGSKENVSLKPSVESGIRLAVERFEEAPQEAIRRMVEYETKHVEETKTAQKEQNESLLVRINKAINDLLKLIPENPDDEARYAFQNAAANIAKLQKSLTRVLAIPEPRVKRLEESEEIQPDGDDSPAGL